MSATSVQKSKQPIIDVVQSTSLKRTDSSKLGQTLRMAASAPKKKMLVCQDQLSKKASRVHSADTENAIDALLDATTQDDAPVESKPTTQRRQLQERLARIAKKKVGGEDAVVEKGNSLQQPGTKHEATHTTAVVLAPESRPQTPQEQNGLELAQLDRMIMPPEHPASPGPEPPPPEDRQLRRVVSESNKPSAPRPKRVPGAPVRITPSPANKSPSTTATPGHTEHAASNSIPTTAPQPKPRGNKPMQRAVTLNTTSNGTSTVILSKPFKTPKSPIVKATEPEKPPDPWSREAFDLFSWRPPGWCEESWKFKETWNA